MFAKILKASVDKPYPETSSLYRVINSSIGLQVDFITKAHGINSFAGLKSRSEKIKFGNQHLIIANLDDIIKSKTAANRPMDLAVLPVLKITNNEKKKNSNKKSKKKANKSSQRSKELALLKKASKKNLLDMIRRNLALPVKERLNFLRVKPPNGGSAL